MNRVGILGGTFNPIHIGHLAMAQIARDQCRLDQVIFVPCYLPPHKNIRNLVRAGDRFRMTKLGIRGNPFFTISDFEIKKKGKSFTIDTLRHFHAWFPKGTKFFFIVGGDNLPELPAWRDIREILKLATFIVINRPGHQRKGSSVKHISVQMPGLDVSASYLRKCIKQGKSIRYFVPDAVRQYIVEKKLYRI